VEKRDADNVAQWIGARARIGLSRRWSASRFSGSRKSRRLQMFAGTDTPARGDRDRRDEDLRPAVDAIVPAEDLTVGLRATPAQDRAELP